MNAQVVLLPKDLLPADIVEKTVVVFDVLRATTTMAAALAAGVSEIRIFDNVESARAAAGAFSGPRVLCGEINSLPPAGFDLGNSPGDFRSDRHAGQTVFMSTTNGTRAIVAARAAGALFLGALVNARSAARAAMGPGRDVTLLCSGTNGAVSMEDVLGAGAVLDAMLALAPCTPIGDTAHIALRLFRDARGDLPKALRESAGGRNVIRAGLAPDIDFCANLNAISIVGKVQDNPLAVRCEV